MTQPRIEVLRPITFRLTNAQVVWSVIVLVLYMLSGTALAVSMFLWPMLPTDARALGAASAIALAAASSSYLRKLYKAGITMRIDAVDATWGERFGSQLYLLIRPLMASLIALVAAMGLVVNFYSTAPSGVEPTAGIVHVALLVGFSIGALSSKALREVDESGKVPLA